jgi:hypothetical protein
MPQTVRMKRPRWTRPWPLERRVLAARSGMEAEPVAGDEPGELGRYAVAPHVHMNRSITVF